jgi:hypothetical protein
MPTTASTRCPVTIANVMMAVAESLTLWQPDQAEYRDVHISHTPLGLSVVVSFADFHWFASIADQCQLDEDTHSVQEWVDREVAYPLTVALKSHFRAAST